MTSPSQAVTTILNAACGGDRESSEALLPLVYEELRSLARRRLSAEPAGQTLQPTALVHEAYLRLLGESEVHWQGRGHFFAAAAEAMRRIIIERARRYATEKHGGGRKRRELSQEDCSIDSLVNHAADLLDLEQGLTRLEQRDLRKSQIVKLRFFAGLSIEETAAVMELSPATVKNEWRFARAWLHSEMDGHGVG